MVVDELKESVRLGQDMERDGFLKPQRVAETIKTLKMFRKLCDASGVSRIITVATEAVRKAKNQRSFLDEIQANCGLKIKVLTAEEINAKDHFYKIDPASEGLVSYWKFNDNNTKDKVVKDYSGNGFHLETKNNANWQNVSVPAED